MSKLFCRVVVILFIVTFCNFSYSQGDEQAPQPLSKILQILEDRYDVRFSFEPKTITGKTAELPNDTLTLRQALNTLKATTNLDFKLLSNRFIAVTPSEIKSQFIVQKLEEIVIKNYLTKGIKNK